MIIGETMLPYTEIIKGKLLDYTEDRIVRIETWLTNNCIFKAYWLSQNESFLPTTINYSYAIQTPIGYNIQ